MAEDAVNPYAPPSVEVSVPPEKEQLWSVVGGYLAVRDGAHLPPIDLEGDGSDGPLTPVTRQCALSFKRASGLPAVVKFRGYVSVASFNARWKRTKWGPLVTFVGAFLMVIGYVGVEAGSEIGYDDTRVGEAASFMLASAGVGVVGLLLIIGLAVWHQLRGVRCFAMRDGWFYLRGISARSLARFSMRVGEAPIMRKRKVYRFYSYRLPLTFLIRRHWYNPLYVVVVAMMKARRAPALESLHLHPSEDSWRPPAQGDAELFEQWRRETKGTEMERWEAVGAKTIHLPSGAMQIELMSYLSADRKCAATILINRISIGRYSAVIRQSVLRSWTDEQCIQTTTPPCIAVHSPWIDRLKVRGKLPHLLDRHLAFVAGRTVIAVQNDEQLFKLLAKESEEELAAFEAAGLQGPVEVMEIAEYPATSSIAKPPPYPGYSTAEAKR